MVPSAAVYRKPGKPHSDSPTEYRRFGVGFERLPIDSHRKERPLFISRACTLIPAALGSNAGRYLDSTTYFFSDSEDLVEEAAEAFAGALAGCTVPGSEGAVCHAGVGL